MDSEQKIRKPAVAGMFYPADAKEIKKIISTIALSEQCKIKADQVTGNIIGGIVPHAGYIYSGFEAYHFFEIVKRKKTEFETVVILNPDHQGYCSEYAASPHEFWETPLGKLKVDTELATFFPQSEIAHRMEHSAEVMIPFIQEVLGNNYQILPISIGIAQPKLTAHLADILHRAVNQTKRKVLVIASSDFSHYVEPSLGVKLDDMALEKILAFDSNGLNDVVRKNRLSVCGFGPIMALIEYSNLMVSKPKAKILARGNSGKHSSSDSVVDYISIAITD